MYHGVCELFSYISQTLIECSVFARPFAKYWAHKKERHSVNNMGHLFALGLNYFSHHPRQDISVYPEKTLRQAKSVPEFCASSSLLPSNLNRSHLGSFHSCLSLIDM